MRIDIGNALEEVAPPGISRAGLDRLGEEVATAHERIEDARAEGEFGYAALDLPETTDPATISRAVEPVSNTESVLTIGIGGSALGAATLSAALGVDGHHVLDNVDPVQVSETLDRLDLDRTAVNVVSRSGTTVETLANFLVVREAMGEAGVDWTNRTVVTTGESGPLRLLAERHDLPSLAVPAGVPGRFSAFSAVGLAPLSILGGDVEGVLGGARAEAASLSGSLLDCPAYAYGAVCSALARRGAAVNAMMPYAERLETFAEWFAQLWAEGLGKDGKGQTPVRALGATDQHSQLQLYRAGPRNLMVTFVRPREREEVGVPNTGDDDLAYLGGTDLGALLDVELKATEASLAAAGRPSVRIEIERMDAAGVGKLLYGMEAACVLAAELDGVNAFDQPAVEWGKRAVRGLLGAEETEEARAVGEKTELWVG